MATTNARLVPEQIAAMEARGWTYRPDRLSFYAHAPLHARDEYRIALRVNEWGDGAWRASYGFTGVGINTLAEHADPLLAADEAERWLHAALSAFRFPWLHVDEVSPAQP